MTRENNKQNKEGFEEGVYIGVPVVKNPIKFDCLKYNKNYNTAILGEAGKGMSFYHKNRINEIAKGGR